MSNIEDLENAINNLVEIGRREYGCKNIFTKEGYIELIMSKKLGHTWNPNIRESPDAWDENGVPTEYKSVNINKTPTFQFCGLTKAKIDGFSTHAHLYWTFKDGSKILEIFKINMRDIIVLCLEKLGDKEKSQVTISLNDLNNRNIVVEKVY